MSVSRLSSYSLVPAFPQKGIQQRYSKSPQFGISLRAYKPNPAGWVYKNRNNLAKSVLGIAAATSATYLYGEPLHEVVDAAAHTVTEATRFLGPTLSKGLGYISGEAVEVGGECLGPIVGTKTAYDIGHDKITGKKVTTRQRINQIGKTTLKCGLPSWAAHGLFDFFGTPDAISCDHKHNHFGPHIHGEASAAPEQRTLLNRIGHVITHCEGPHHVAHGIHHSLKTLKDNNKKKKVVKALQKTAHKAQQAATIAPNDTHRTKLEDTRTKLLVLSAAIQSTQRPSLKDKIIQTLNQLNPIPAKKTATDADSLKAETKETGQRKKKTRRSKKKKATTTKTS